MKYGYTVTQKTQWPRVHPTPITQRRVIASSFYQTSSLFISTVPFYIMVYTHAVLSQISFRNVNCFNISKVISPFLNKKEGF